MCLIINSTSPPRHRRGFPISRLPRTALFSFSLRLYLYTVSFVRYFYRLTADTRLAVFTLFFLCDFSVLLFFFFSKTKYNRRQCISSAQRIFYPRTYVHVLYTVTPLFVSRRKRRRRYAQPTGIDGNNRAVGGCSVVKFTRTPRYPVLAGTRHANPTNQTPT